MKASVVILGLCLMMTTGTAEAGLGSATLNVFSYAVSPVNCVLNLSTAVVAQTVSYAKGLVADVVGFGECFLANMNRNPATLAPVITQPIVVPTT